MNNFTPEDLLEFYYGEMPESRASDLKDALENDWTLREKMSILEEASNRLDKSFYSPRVEVINKIIALAERQIIESIPS